MANAEDFQARFTSPSIGSDAAKILHRSTGGTGFSLVPTLGPYPARRLKEAGSEVIDHLAISDLFGIS